MSVQTLNTITNDLILSYEEKFNELYMEQTEINNAIMNKEEIIIKENDEIYLKENKIIILQYIILGVILFGALLFLNALNKLTLIQLLISTIILIIIFTIIIYFVVYNRMSSYKVEKIIKNVIVDMEKYIHPDANYKCPKKCSDNPTATANTPPTTQPIVGYEQPTLNIQPQTNVWKYGDISAGLWTSDKTPASTFYNDQDIPNYNQTFEQQLANEPKPTFGTTYPMTTYYQCNWLGAPNNNGLPNTEQNIYSTIPCRYRQNFMETGRYLCNADPNLSTTNFDDSCDVLS